MGMLLKRYREEEKETQEKEFVSEIFPPDKPQEEAPKKRKTKKSEE